MASDAEARIWAVLGASGSGKSLWWKGKVRAEKPRRFIMWDFMNEGAEFATQATSLESIRKAMIAAGKDGPLRLRYVPRGAGEKPMKAEFEALCNLVYAWGNCTFVVEELANVTMPSWAPAAWRKMTTSGRHKLVHIIGCSQTPAMIDKAFMGNATLIHCGPLREHAHREAVAKSMDIDGGRIAKLVKLQWLEKDFDSGVVTTGFVAIPGKRARPSKVVPATDATPTGSGARRASKVV
jgi:hypothetical protein